jgi:hypothetical protein
VKICAVKTEFSLGAQTLFSTCLTLLFFDCSEIRCKEFARTGVGCFVEIGAVRKYFSEERKCKYIYTCTMKP